MTSLYCTSSQPADGSAGTVHGIGLAERRTGHIWTVVRRDDDLQGKAAWAEMLLEHGFPGAAPTEYGFTNAPPAEPGTAVANSWEAVVASRR